MYSDVDFIRESNLIDKQHDEKGILIPGQNTGDPMYDNQLKSINMIPALCAVKPTPKYLILVLHRELTRGIGVFEDRGDSGNYRKCDVYIGGEKAPNTRVAQKIIEEILIPEIEKTRHQKLDKDQALKFAWWCHDLFECAHPFVDGNGRTGRLLLNTVLAMLGHEKIVVFYDKRFDYYAKIKEFRQTVFPELLTKTSSN